MNKWSPERAEAIRQFIDEYFMENRKSPGTGISKSSVQRYLTDMKEHGEIEYNGRRSIGTNLSRNMFETTPVIRYDSTVSCGLPCEPNVEDRARSSRETKSCRPHQVKRACPCGMSFLIYERD